MATPKILSTPAEHAAAAERLSTILDIETRTDAVRDEVKLLLLLIEDYERRNVAPLNALSPRDAILFRMEQQGLTPRDLVPYLGSPSRVSEILSGKRGLSISMIRALHQGLQIPADSLIGEPDRPMTSNKKPKGAWIDSLKRRGWVPNTRPDIVAAYLQPITRLETAAAYRRTRRSGVDEDAVVAWTARVYHAATERAAEAVFTTKFDVLLEEVIKLSWADEGPRLAVEFLRRQGVPVVIEPQLPGMQLDGVAIRLHGFVAIGLTLRFDRLDSFWFTLAHEMGHLIATSDESRRLFVDDLEVPASDETERRADEIAREYLIPTKIWERSAASRLRSPQAVEHLARELRIHPAIVAGRVRFESGSWKILSSMVGTGEVRRQFPEISWND